MSNISNKVYFAIIAYATMIVLSSSSIYAETITEVWGSDIGAGYNQQASGFQSKIFMLPENQGDAILRNIAKKMQAGSNLYLDEQEMPINVKSSESEDSKIIEIKTTSIENNTLTIENFSSNNDIIIKGITSVFGNINVIENDDYRNISGVRTKKEILLGSGESYSFNLQQSDVSSEQYTGNEKHYDNLLIVYTADGVDKKIDLGEYSIDLDGNILSFDANPPLVCGVINEAAICITTKLLVDFYKKEKADENNIAKELRKKEEEKAKITKRVKKLTFTCEEEKLKKILDKAQKLDPYSSEETTKKEFKVSDKRRNKRSVGRGSNGKSRIDNLDIKKQQVGGAHAVDISEMIKTFPKKKGGSKGKKNSPKKGKEKLKKFLDGLRGRMSVGIIEEGQNIREEDNDIMFNITEYDDLKNAFKVFEIKKRMESLSDKQGIIVIPHLSVGDRFNDSFGEIIKKIRKKIPISSEERHGLDMLSGHGVDLRHHFILSRKQIDRLIIMLRYLEKADKKSIKRYIPKKSKNFFTREKKAFSGITLVSRIKDVNLSWFKTICEHLDGLIPVNHRDGKNHSIRKDKSSSKEGWDIYKASSGDYIALLHMKTFICVDEYVAILTELEAVPAETARNTKNGNFVLKLLLDLSSDEKIREIEQKLKKAGEILEEYYKK